MTKKELVKNAYEQFYEYVEKSVDENGWVKREEHSGFMRNHFYLGNNIETKVVDKVEYWRPKTLEGIKNNNGWILIKSEADLPKESYNYWIMQSDGLIQTLKEYEENKKYWNIHPTHYQPITKPNLPLWMEEK